MKLLLIGLLLASRSPAYPAETVDPAGKYLAEAQSSHLWEDRYWRLLMHYEPSIFGLKSGVRNQEFFLSPKGRTKPRAEMEAFIRALFEKRPADPDQDIRCRFPLRSAWLGARLNLSPDLVRSDCPKYEEWRDTVHVDSVTLVFAAAYLNNPSSMYGHTFLRFDQNKHGDKDLLLNYAVNFAADDSATDNPILYVVYGTTGIFPGYFSAMPYYLKVQEYSNLESRDLWEYRLNLDTSTIDRLAMHTWEMDKARFGYYFFTKNCSYQLLPLLETADPRLHLSNHRPLYLIPIDTARTVVRQSGLLSRVVYRPSRVTVMLWRRDRLTPPEIRLVERLVKRNDSAAWEKLLSLHKERQVLALDSAADYIQYLSDFRPSRESANKEILRKILLSRGSINIPSTPIDVPVPAAPDKGHESLRLGTGYGFGDRHFIEADIRPAFHDLLDPPEGYVQDTDLEMIHLKLRHDFMAGKNYVQSFDFVRILSLSPYDRWIWHPSWGINAGERTAEELDPRPWKAGYFGLGAEDGVTYETHLFRRETAYAMAAVDSGFGGIFHEDYRLGGGGMAGLLVDVSRNLNLQARIGYTAYGLGGDRRPVARKSVEASWTESKNLAFRIKFERTRQYDEALASFQAFF